MNRFWMLLTTLMLTTVAVAQERERHRELNEVASPGPDSTIAITNVRLIDGRGGEPIDNACVLVRGNTIEKVGLGTNVSIPSSAAIVDAKGKSLIPGLFDSHFHSINNTEMPVTFELNNGITSFRDPGHPFKYYDKLLAFDGVYPRVFLCGGHLDAAPAVWPDQAVVIETSSQAASAVDAHVNRGASAIKVYFRLPLDHIEAACSAASKRNVPVTAHLEMVSAEDAIRAGINGIEHITSFGTAIASMELASQYRQIVTDNSDARKEWRPRLWQRVKIDGNPKVEAAIELVVKEGIFISPTLAIYEARVGDKDATQEKVEGFENMMTFFRRCHQAGARIVVGSHTWAKHAASGKAYLREVQLMYDAGMSPLAIITAATKNNADFFGVSDRLGTIEVGKTADLVLIDGDPSADISDLDKVDSVMLNGLWVFGRSQ